MLIATPYRNFDIRDRSPPKVISEIRKSYLNSTVTSNLRPKLSEELLVKWSTETNWYPRRVQIEGGQLQVLATPDELSVRIPLRHLSLQAGSLPHSLAICRGQNIVLSLQAPSELSFDRWVKTLAIELIRQTPLDAIKYLDILTLTDCWSRRDDNYSKDWNFNNVVFQKEPPFISCEMNRLKESKELAKIPKLSCNAITTKTFPKASITFSVDPPSNFQPEPPNSNTPEEVVETLLRKCQNVETYVPVKEKLFLFESLCKMGRKVRSSEDVSLKPEKSVTRRAKSCHDLSKLNTQVAVRQICKYFENRGTNNINNSPLKDSHRNFQTYDKK